MTASTDLPSLSGILAAGKVRPIGRVTGAEPDPGQRPAPEPAGVERTLQHPTAAGSPDRASGKGEAGVQTDSGDDVVYVTSRTVYLPRSVHRAANRWVRNRREVSWTTLILDALNETHLELATFFAAAGPTVRSSDLFMMPQRSKVTSEPSFQITVRLTDEQLDVIDQLSSRHNVTRSRLLTAAVRLYLTPRMPNERWNDLLVPKTGLSR